MAPADPVAYFLSLNLHRRQLTASQLALIGARARDCYDHQAKERQRAALAKGNSTKHGKTSIEGPVSQSTTESRSRDVAGRAVGVSGSYIDKATRVLRDGAPELIKAVEAGTVTVKQALAVVTEPVEVQVAAASKPQPAGRQPKAATAGPQQPGRC